jgi:predicted glycoside hydrolase/deacetylase ChbG (UPF0249 family)
LINKNIIINADDLGMTPGTNYAIFKGFDEGFINSSSIMTNCDYFDEAVDMLQTRQDLKIGIHLNLTYGLPLKHSNLYTSDDGYFNLSYLQLVYKSIFDKNFLSLIKVEFEAQIERALKKNINISHLDSHRHIHLIPNIYKVVFSLSEKYNIERIRLVNENFFNSIHLTRKFNFFLNGGIIKFFLLKFFTFINRNYGDKYKQTTFYSILYTGYIDKDFLSKILNSHSNYEIAVHPSDINLDKNISFYNQAEKSYRLSKDRLIELSNILK